MTVKELILILSGFPEDTIIAHEKYMQREYESIELKSFEYNFNKRRLTFKD